jgi:hypothetical protein
VNWQWQRRALQRRYLPRSRASHHPAPSSGPPSRSVGRTLATDTVRSPRGGGTQVMINMLPKLEWAVLLEAATDVGEWATAARPQPLALGPAQLRWLACEQRAPPLRAAGQATLVGQHI